MKRTVLMLFAALALAAIVSSIPAVAHHSFAATYDEEREQKISGALVTFLFRNPHSFIHIDAPDQKGVTQRWVVEWGGGNTLDRSGVTRDTLRAGDELVVVGKPGRNPEDHRLRMVSVERPKDGWKWSGTFE
jgi:hypothetical protein